MVFFLVLLNLFGPIVGESTISPLNTFKGAGIVMPAAKILYSGSTDTTNYIAISAFGFYYNLDEHITFGADLAGRFEYLQTDSSQNGIYPEVVRVGTKFGFPVSKNADMGIAMHVGLPLYVVGLKDTTDILNYPIARKVYPGVDIYCLRHIGKLGFAWNAGYRGNSYQHGSSDIHYEGILRYKFGGVRPFGGFRATAYTKKLQNERPVDFDAILGVSFVSDFNASFTIAFIARPFKNDNPVRQIFLPDNDFKYGLLLNIESWVAGKRYTRNYTPRNEKPAKLVLIKRFVNVGMQVLDTTTHQPLKDVTLDFYRNGKKVKNLKIMGYARVDSLIRGHYKIALEKEMYVKKDVSIDLRKDTTLIVYLKKRQLKDTGWLVLTIKDGRGNPVAGASVSIVDLGLKKASDSGGMVVFKTKSGNYLVSIKKKGYRPVTRYFVINKEGKTREVISLKKK